LERLEYDSYGGSELVRLRAFTLPKPTGDEVVVRVIAASINPMDWRIRSGQMKFLTGSKFPRAMGTEFSGIVEAVGSKVLKLKAGDAVLGSVTMKASGAFAPKLITNQNLLMKKPDSLSFAKAACLPIAGVTAWVVLIKNAQLKRGQKLFINGASGAVGQVAISIARDIGADVAGRVAPLSIALAQTWGLSPVLDYTKPLPSSLDGSFDVVFDCNGSLTPGESGRLLKRGGKIFDIAPTPSKFIRAMFSRRRKVVISETKVEYLQSVVNLAVAGKLAIPVVRTISLAEAPALLASLERGERLNGKVVMVFGIDPIIN
jgi:NADPH:quinone reductase-like Zn-dependent oxidoreductase